MRHARHPAQAADRGEPPPYRAPSRRVITRSGSWATNCLIQPTSNVEPPQQRFRSAAELGVSEAVMLPPLAPQSFEPEATNH